MFLKACACVHVCVCVYVCACVSMRVPTHTMYPHRSAGACMYIQYVCTYTHIRTYSICIGLQIRMYSANITISTYV